MRHQSKREDNNTYGKCSLNRFAEGHRIKSLNLIKQASAHAATLIPFTMDNRIDLQSHRLLMSTFARNDLKVTPFQVKSDYFFGRQYFFTWLLRV